MLKKKLFKVRTIVCLGCSKKLVHNALDFLSMHKCCEDKLGFTIVSSPVRARTRKLRAVWNAEFM